MRPDFNKMELIPAIVQDYQTKEVLMLAYVNEEAYDKMLELKQTVFYSRSRQKLWHKGEESGHFQDIKGMYLDCDLDTLLIYVKQERLVILGLIHASLMKYKLMMQEIFLENWKKQLLIVRFIQLKNLIQITY